MSIFGRKKKEEDKKDVKTSDVSVSKKDDKKKVVKKEEKKVDKKEIGVKQDRAYKVLIRPIISEKTTNFASLNKYVFEVFGKTNKIEIKKAIEELYQVKPIQVNIIKRKGKNVRFGKTSGRTKDSKRAIVTLKKGDSIKLYEGI